MEILESRYGIECVDELAERIAEAVKRSIQRMHEEKGWSSVDSLTIRVVVDGDMIGFKLNLIEDVYEYAQKVLTEEYNTVR